jgi:hypothetical protein
MVPSRLIYHITHVENLPEIIADGALFSEHRLIADGRKPAVIGMDHLKERRLRKKVLCHPHLTVGDFVPFYFCPRSIMLYVIDKRHSELAPSFIREFLDCETQTEAVRRLRAALRRS